MELKTPYFKKHLKWLLVLGVDIIPVKNVWYKYFYKLWSLFIIGFVVLYTLLEVIDILNTSDFNSMTFGLCYSATHLLGLAKIIILIVKKKKVREMLNELESGDFLPKIERGGEEEIRLINIAVTRCARHAEIFNLIVYSIVSIRCLYALFDTGYNDELFDEQLNTTTPIHTRILPYRIWLPIETTKSPIFEIVFFFQAFTLTLYGYYIGMMDSMVYGMMIHMNTQYLILKRVLERYVSIATNMVSKNLLDKGVKDIRNGVISLPVGYERIDFLSEPVQEKVREIVHNCAKHHVHILEFCEKVEKEFSYLMLSQFLFSLYTLCFQLYQLSLMANVLSFDFISMCCYLTLLMYQLFCYCFYGNEIMVQSEKFSEALYNSDWLVLDNSTKKSLLLMMMRAQRPIRFTAGKFALLSLQTFMAIVRGSASYFMVLRQMNR
ncbi:odorant receptor Or1-like [Anoplophora glabripennis]|uniref:odorant receptor Or1-like n=1 Tax=Anoplophora glabripennis TaxID=217634 RepID=UPI000A14496C|nr:odorant receptor Or1-like [Anoplophora glabripennis]